MSSQKASPVSWLVWSDVTNEVIVSGELQDQSELSSLSRYAQGRPVTVLANSGDVRLIKHMSAIKPTRQVLKALPYMLEDELADDIEKLHFAIQDVGFDKELEQHFINIAVVNKVSLAGWVSLLADHDIRVNHILPEVLCIPLDEKPEHISLIEIANGYLIREGEWQGCFIEKDWLPLYAQQMSNKTINFYSPLPKEVIDAAEDEEKSITLIAEDPELPMLLLAQQAAKQKWNLLQGEFAPKKPVSKAWQTWRPVAILGGLLLVIQFVMMTAQWQQQKSRLASAQQELANTYQQAFPKEKLRINLLKRQLQSKVKAISGGGTTASSFDYLSVMQKLSSVFKSFSAVKIENLRFDGKRNELRISAVAPSFQEFEKFRVAIVDLGLEVNPGAVNNDGSVVTGSLSIKESR